LHGRGVSWQALVKSWWRKNGDLMPVPSMPPLSDHRKLCL